MNDYASRSIAAEAGKLRLRLTLADVAADWGGDSWDRDLLNGVASMMDLESNLHGNFDAIQDATA